MCRKARELAELIILISSDTVRGVRVHFVLVPNFNGLLQGDLQYVGGQLRQNVTAHAQIVDPQNVQRGLKAVQLNLEIEKKTK